MNVLFNYYFNFPFCLIQDLEPTKIVACKNKEYKSLQIQQNKEKSLQTSEMFSTSMQGSYQKWDTLEEL